MGPLAGCSSSQADDGRLQLRFTYYGTIEDLRVWDELIRRYNLRQDRVRIKPEHIAGQAYNSKLMAMMVGNVAPDVMLSDDEYFTEMAVNGLFEPLDTYMSREPHLSRDRFYPQFLDTWLWNGKQWALPSHGHCLVIFYNRELLRDAGLPDPPADWTWDDFIAYGRALTIDANNDGRPEQFGALWPTWLHSLSWVWSMGGEFVPEDRRHCVIDSPRATQGLRFQWEQIHRYQMTPHTGELPGMNWDAMFMNGRVAMALNGSWWLDQAVVAPNLDWDIQEIPLAPNPDYPEGHRETRATCEGLAISSATPYKEEAWDWISFVLEDENQALFSEYRRGIPAIRSVAERVIPRADTPQHEERFLLAMQYARPQNLYPRWMETAQVMNREWDLMNLGERTPAEATARAAREITKILQEQR